MVVYSARKALRNETRNFGGIILKPNGIYG